MPLISKFFKDTCELQGIAALTGSLMETYTNNFLVSSKDQAIEAGVRVLGCACDTDGSLTVSIDEANAEECIHVQHSMTETDEDPEGHEFLGMIFIFIYTKGNSITTWARF